MEEPKRGKAKITKDYITKDLYNYYKNNSSNPVSYEKYMDFLYGSTKSYRDVKRKQNEGGLIKKFTNEIIYNAYVLSLPCGGTLSVRKYKPKVKFKPNGDLDFEKSKITIDWKTTRELWAKDPIAEQNATLCYFYNKHTRGYQYNYYWDKNKLGNVVNKYFYKFTPTRALSRELAKVLKEDPNIDYYTS
jgi:hypothetical protein